MLFRSLFTFLLFMTTSSSFAAPIVIAHRGASGYLPEHTLAAKAMAHAQGADVIEQDVVLTHDDVPIVLHDIHLDAVSDVAEKFPGRQRTDGRFYALDFTLDEIRQLRVSERRNPTTGQPVFPGRFPTEKGAFPIPTLEEELNLLAGLARSTGREAGIYPEIKQPAWHRDQGHDISPIVLEVLRRHGYDAPEARCHLQCFDATEVRRLRHDLGWKGRLVLLVEDLPRDISPAEDPLLAAGVLDELARTVDGIGPAMARVLDDDGSPTRLTAAAHAAGLVVHPYTLRCDRLPTFAANADALLTALFTEAGVDGVFTDFPDVCVRWITTHAPASSRR